MEGLNQLKFIGIMEFTADEIKSNKNPFPSLLKKITIFKIKCQWNKKENDDKKICGKSCYKML